jgi:hypothetical protein
MLNDRSDRSPRWLASDPGFAALVSPPTEVRVGLVARVRREIAAGAYETPEKWEAAFDRLLEAVR